MGRPLPISRIMRSGLLLRCSPQTPITDAAARMAEHQVSSILITEDDQVTGIWTERDALMVDFSDPASFRRPVSSVMSSPVLTLPADMDAGEAALRFRDTGKRHFLIVDDSNLPIGILSQTDLALNQGLEPYLRLREVSTAIPHPPLVIDGQVALADVPGRFAGSTGAKGPGTREIPADPATGGAGDRVLLRRHHGYGQGRKH